jgi:hypothetical protein
MCELDKVNRCGFVAGNGWRNQEAGGQPRDCCGIVSAHLSRLDFSPYFHTLSGLEANVFKKFTKEGEKRKWQKNVGQTNRRGL